uniref:Uncharacterized protein n=1 Tax=Glossina brevipalpis TaxID=37001 RepID=A0A1A9W3N7_9MUSC
MPTLEGGNTSTGISVCAEQSNTKSRVSSPKLNSNNAHDSSSINNLETRYLDSAVAVDNSEHFHNANDCSNNGQNIMAATTTVISTSLASFNGNSNINNNGNPNTITTITTSTNNSITCNSNHKSNCKTITNNSGNVCHTNINEMNNFTKIAVSSPKMTSKSEHITDSSNITINTTQIFVNNDDNVVNTMPTSAFIKPQQQQQQQLEQSLYTSREDVTSLAGSSSLNSQVSLNVNHNASNNSNNNNQNATMVSTSNASSQTNAIAAANNNNLSGILKGSKAIMPVKSLIEK